MLSGLSGIINSLLNINIEDGEREFLVLKDREEHFF